MPGTQSMGKISDIGDELLRDGSQVSVQAGTQAKESHPMESDTLESREERYRMILENIHDGYFETALNGRVTYLNDGLVRIFGGNSKADLLDANIAEFTDDQNARRLREVAREVFLTGESIPSFIYKTRRRNGEWYDADISLALMKDDDGRRIGYRGIIRDVTERRRMENVLRESEERFRTLAETASDAIMTIDESNKIVFANSAFNKVFGYAPEDVIGQDVTILIPETQRTRHTLSLASYLKTGSQQMSWSAIEWVGMHRDGHQIPIELSLGEFVRNGRRYFTGVVRDITERKHSEALISGQVGIFEMIATGQPLSAMLDRIARLVGDIAGNLSCSIFLLDAEDGFLHAAASHGIPDTFQQARQKVAVGLHSGSCGAAVHLRLPVVSADISVDPLWEDSRDFMRGHGFYASWSTPIFNADREVLGTINILYDQVHHPQPYEMEFVNVAAHLASIAIERSKAEERLRKSEARFRALIEKSADGIALTDENGIFLYASQSAYRILGYSPDEIIGKTAEQRIHPEDWQRLSETAHGLSGRQGSSDTVRYRVRHKNGTWLWVEATLTNLFDEPSVRALVVNFSDITQSKLADDKLRVSEERYRSLVAALDEGIFLIDKHGVLLAANSTAEKILGMTVQEIKKRTLFDPNWDAVHEDESSFEVSDYPAVVTLRTGKALSNIVMGVRKPDGKQVTWISVNTQPLMREGESSPYAVVSSFSDITEQLRAQAELRKSEEHYRLLFEHSFAGIARLTTGGDMVECNEALAQMLGCNSPEELIATNQSKFYFDLADRQQLLDRLIEQGSLHNYEVRMRRLDGSAVWTLVNASLLQSRDGGEPVLEGVILDITERKLTEQKLEQLYEQSRALSARIETVREEERAHIAREIHDNLGQMMTGLKLDFSWLEKKISRVKDEKLHQEVKPKFDEIAKLLEETIQTVRNIASDLRPGVLDTLGLREAIEWQVREFKLRTGVKCSVKLCQEPKDLPPQQATALFRILQELLTNITRHAKATSVRIEMTKTSEELRLSVSDDGIGITEEQIRNPKSLGLLGMRERAMILGGNLTISGHEGHGTIAKVQMPIQDKTGQQASRRTGRLRKSN